MKKLKVRRNILELNTAFIPSAQGPVHRQLAEVAVPLACSLNPFPNPLPFRQNTVTKSAVARWQWQQRCANTLPHSWAHGHRSQDRAWMGSSTGALARALGQISQRWWPTIGFDPRKNSLPSPPQPFVLAHPSIHHEKTFLSFHQGTQLSWPLDLTLPTATIWYRATHEGAGL